MLKEFKEFALKGNILDMAIGVIIGTAFGLVVNSLVNDIIMPPLGVILGGLDFSKFALVLKHGATPEETVTLNYGAFLNTIVNFLVVSFSMYLVVKQINLMNEKLAKKNAQEEAEEVKPEAEEILLLREIRDALVDRGAQK